MITTIPSPCNRIFHASEPQQLPVSAATQLPAASTTTDQSKAAVPPKPQPQNFLQQFQQGVKAGERAGQRKVVEKLAPLETVIDWKKKDEVKWAAESLKQLFHAGRLILCDYMRLLC